MVRGSRLRESAQQLQQDARRRSLFGVSKKAKNKHKAKATNDFLTVSHILYYKKHLSNMTLHCLVGTHVNRPCVESMTSHFL